MPTDLREVVERACRSVCVHCRQPEYTSFLRVNVVSLPPEIIDGIWQHPTTLNRKRAGHVPCMANNIRHEFSADLE